MSDPKPQFKPQIIDVAILVDAPRIIYHYGSNKAKDNLKFSDYTQLGTKGMGVGYVYMATTWWDAQGEGGSELDVFGTKGNTIRWRMQTLSMGGRADGSLDATAPVAYQAFIRGFVISQGETCITAPVQKTETVDSWGGDEDGKVIRKKVVDVYWEAEVVQPGAVIYHTPFNIFCNCPGCSDNGDGGDDNGTGGGGGGGNGCGGYQHDPWITAQQ
ncbi:AidA/PixA family protein [Paraburkholderia sediminicola]|uniref:Inclusion body protein n=1 Tax=Paraburkholderia madseniana TaxID=2599607 RepID=A0A6N6W046_9BURK|nr:AidA/PixA family protein [Paraburkholderia madseniana]KAE8754032.1 hypothetical protein FSO04_41865 [Paraburkholderia madseniana]